PCPSPARGGRVKSCSSASAETSSLCTAVTSFTRSHAHTPTPARLASTRPRAPPSHRQMLPHQVVGQSFDAAAGDDSAFVDDAELARNATCERQLLFDEQHGQLLLLIELEDDIADLVDDVRLNAFGRFIEDQELR